MFTRGETWAFIFQFIMMGVTMIAIAKPTKKGGGKK